MLVNTFLAFLSALCRVEMLQREAGIFE